MAAQTLVYVRQLLVELGSTRGLEELGARGTKAHLERELGLGSLERVELMLRLGDASGVRLPDRVVAEADTVQDLVDAILRAETGDDGNGTGARGATALVASAPTSTLTSSAAASAAPAIHPDIEQQIRQAETLSEILRLRGRGEPGRSHIQIYEEDEQLRTITFGELYERASVVAAELRRRGLEPGQTVAIMLPTCADFFWSFAGILLAGGIPVPIYPPFRADRIAEYAARQSNILRNAEAQFLLTWRQAENLAKLLKPRVPSLREVLNAQKLASAAANPEQPTGEWRPVQHLSHHARGEDIAFLQYTSGSTGDPKGVVLTHANLLANIRAIIAGIDVQPTDACVSWLPLYHDMGLIGAWFVPLYTGIPLVVMSPLAFLSRPERWLRAIHRHRATICPAPNFAYELCVRKIAEKDLEGLDLSSWRAATNGAEPVRAETMERFAKRFAPYGFRREALMPVYGLAEATLAVSVPRLGAGYKVDRIERAQFESEGHAVPVASADAPALEFVNAGKPVPSVEVRIVDADGRNLGERREGRLWFRGPSATSGYYRNPAATRDLLRDGDWIDSGDLAYWGDGEIYITGRAKDVIIKAGRNLYPHEVEEIAGRVAGVRTGCVVAFGAPDERTGTERLVVAAELRDVAAAKRIEGEIARAVDEAMGMPPDVVVLLPPQSIPKTSSGKLRRSETRRLFLEGKLGQKQQAPWVQIARFGSARRGATGLELAPARGQKHDRISVWRVRASRFRGDSDSAVDSGDAHARPAARSEPGASRRTHDAGRRRRTGGNSGRRNSAAESENGPVDFCAEPFQLSGRSGDVGIHAARCALRGQGRDSRHAVHGHAGRAQRTLCVRPQRSAGAHTASGRSEHGAAQRRIGGDFSGRNVYGVGGHTPVSIGRVQSGGGYAAADLRCVRARRAASSARQDDIAAARACDADVQSANCAQSRGRKRLARNCALA